MALTRPILILVLAGAQPALAAVQVDGAFDFAAPGQGVNAQFRGSFAFVADDIGSISGEPIGLFRDVAVTLTPNPFGATTFDPQGLYLVRFSPSEWAFSGSPIGSVFSNSDSFSVRLDSSTGFVNASYSVGTEGGIEFAGEGEGAIRFVELPMQGAVPEAASSLTWLGLLFGVAMRRRWSR